MILIQHGDGWTYGHGIFTEKIKKLLLKKNNKIFLNAQINSFNRGYNTVLKYKKINTLVINEGELRYELRDKHSEVQKLAKKLFLVLLTNLLLIAVPGDNNSTTALFTIPLDFLGSSTCSHNATLYPDCNNL